MPSSQISESTKLKNKFRLGYEIILTKAQSVFKILIKIGYCKKDLHFTC